MGKSQETFSKKEKEKKRLKKRQEKQSKLPRAQVITEGAVVIWQEHFSEDGYVYYYNAETGLSEWEQPTGSNIQIVSQYQDSYGSWYWFNNITGETEWIQ